jgi:hypothetical protein
MCEDKLSVGQIIIDIHGYYSSQKNTCNGDIYVLHKLKGE